MESVASGESKLSPSAAGKKMKQTRLPFQVLTGSPTASSTPTAPRTPLESRKRKPSLETAVVAGDSGRAAKIGRISEAKENVVKDGAKEPDGMIDLAMDEASNANVDLVQFSEEGTSKSDGAAAESGQIKIKLPFSGKKKGKKADGGGSSSKKKATKDKRKKPKKDDKSKKVTGVGGVDTSEPVVADDSDLSDDEKQEGKKDDSGAEGKEVEPEPTKRDSKKDDEKAEEETMEPTNVEIKEVTPRRGRSKTNGNEAKKTPKQKSSAKKSENGSINKVEEQSKQVPENEKTPESDKKSKEMIVDSEEDAKHEEKTTSESKLSAIQPKDESKVEDTESTGKVLDNEKTSDKKPEEVVVESEEDVERKEQEETKTVKSKRSARKSKVESKKVEETTEEVQENAESVESDKKPEVLILESDAKREENEEKAAPKSKRSARKSKDESKKKAEEPTEQVPENEKLLDSAKKTDTVESNNTKESDKDAQKEDKKPPSARGALDKFFAKVQTEKKTTPLNGMKPSDQETAETPAIVISEPDPEAMEVDDEPAGTSESSAKNNNSIVSICLEDSLEGNTADAEENAYMLCTPNSKDRSFGGVANGKLSDKKLTPKQIARKMETEKRLAQKQQELEDRKRKKQEEKEAKLKEKEEQELARKKEKEEKEEQKRKEREEKEEQKRKEKEEKDEAKRKEREEKEEQKRKEREEKEKKRLAESEAKNEEKRKKEEQKEEERRKKEEEKEAEEKRKQKTAQAFQSFFVKKQGNGSGSVKHSDDENSMEQQQQTEGEDLIGKQQQQTFMPFCVKGDMRVAPVCRVTLTNSQKSRLDEVLRKSGDDYGEVVEDRDKLYLGLLKSERYQVGSMDRTWVAQEEDAEDDDVIVVDDNVCHQIEKDPAAAPEKRYRAKFFLFEENRRPPYRGTWRKRSKNIKARRPFAQDTKFFDYEVDSDDEWEEEEPGESLHGSDDEKDVDKEEEDYEVDNDFFVPHGHLSDEELQAEDDVAEDNSPEAQKAKLKILQQEFAAEMKKKTEKIKPRLIGCLWENASGDDDDESGQRSECSAVIWEILKVRAMLFDPEEPVSFTVQKNDPESNQSSPSKDKEPTERVSKPKVVKLVDEGVKELITLIHGSALNRKFLIKEFLAYWAKRRDDGEFAVPQFAPDSIRTKILEVSSWRPCPDEGPMQNKMCWYVNKEALVRYGLTDLKVPTGWNFILKPIVKSKPERKEKDSKEEGEGESSEVKSSKKKRPPTATSSTPKAKPAPSTPTISGITKFTKKLSDSDKQKLLSKEKKKRSAAPSEAADSPSSSSSSAKKPAPSASAAAKPSPSQPKKRVQLLMSVPRGQAIPQATKNNLISQFLARKPPTEPQQQNGPAEHPMEVDDCVIVPDD